MTHKSKKKKVKPSSNAFNISFNTFQPCSTMLEVVKSDILNVLELLKESIIWCDHPQFYLIFSTYSSFLQLISPYFHNYKRIHSIVRMAVALASPDYAYIHADIHKVGHSYVVLTE